MRLKHVGVSSLRVFTSDKLRALQEPRIICDHAEPIAVMVPYALYLEWQERLSVILAPAASPPPREA